MLAPDVVLNGGINVERTNPNGFKGNNASERDHCGFARATTDVDHHVSNGLVDREIGPNCGSHWLLDEVRVGRTGATCRVGDRSSLNLGDC